MAGIINCNTSFNVFSPFLNKTGNERKPSSTARNAHCLIVHYLICNALVLQLLYLRYF